MIFGFLKYIQPTNYFALYKKDGYSVFPIAKELPNNIQQQLQLDKLYTNELSKQYDLSWQALQKGYIGKTKTYTQLEKLPLVDEYYFIRKYFNPLWASYILLLRILGFNNPLKEIGAWKKSKKGKRSDYLKTPIVYENWEEYSSKLIAEQPKVSVIIPTLNRYPYLKDVLEDLEKQDYKNFEVIVVDQSETFSRRFLLKF